MGFFSGLSWGSSNTTAHRGLVEGNSPKVGIEPTCYALTVLADDQVAARPPASDLLSHVQNPDGNWPAFGTTDPREMQDDCALTLEWTNPKMGAKTAVGIREVKLMGPGLKVLQTQKTHTVLRNAQVFQNPRTGERWTGDKAYGRIVGSYTPQNWR